MEAGVGRLERRIFCLDQERCLLAEVGVGAGANKDETVIQALHRLGDDLAFQVVMIVEVGLCGDDDDEGERTGGVGRECEVLTVESMKNLLAQRI